MLPNRVFFLILDYLKQRELTLKNSYSSVKQKNVIYVQQLDDSLRLRFTLIFAFHCGLHRMGNQGIHH